MKVFLSSTAHDLRPHRQVVDDTILRLSQQVDAMERFGPLPGDPVTECERRARESDLAICIVAHRYGFEPEKGQGSITWREVKAAKKAGKDVLVWIVDDSYPWVEKKEQDLLTDPTVLVEPARVAEVVHRIGALGMFKSWLRETFICDSFSTPDDLGRRVAVAVANHVNKAPARTRPAPRWGNVRVVHALQPAPHFQGREALIAELTGWVADLASPDRVWSLVAAGGTGKTAVAERVVRYMQPGEANVLAWSFYENPDADAFLRECNQLFLGEESGPAGGRLERLERGLRDGRPHLIVLDGLERVQEDGGAGRVRGELSDQTLKLLLRALASGLGRARALVTSRYPLVDLQDWSNRGYRGTRLDDLEPDSAVAVLRGWGVTGDDVALRATAAQVGYHALSVAVIGSYLRSFADGRIDEVAGFNLDAVTGDDPKAAKLARVLAFYAERLPADERGLLARVSVFPRGVTLQLLRTLVDAGGDVAGTLRNAKDRLAHLLNSLKERGLVFEYRSDAGATWTGHPFLREKFRDLLDCPPERVFEVVAAELGAGLNQRPATRPSDPAMLDKYERLIEAKRLCGRTHDAFAVYSDWVGGYRNLGWVLGDYQRGHRILAEFSASGRFEDLALGCSPDDRSALASELALFALSLGRVEEAWAVRCMDDEWRAARYDPAAAASGLRNSALVAIALGRLVEARGCVERALAVTDQTNEFPVMRGVSVAERAAVLHALGDPAAARADFSTSASLQDEALVSMSGSQHARHLLDLGSFDAARAVCQTCLDAANTNGWNQEFAWFHSLLARIDLAEGNDPTDHLNEIRNWTSRTGDMQWIIEAHLLTARHLLRAGDHQAALGEAEAGLLHAVSCGYGLLRIELLTALSRIRLAWPDPPRAIQAAREALDLATHPQCQYAWGEADAAQAWGEAYFANHEPTLAKRALTHALSVRKRIEHPGVKDSEIWIGRVG